MSSFDKINNEPNNFIKNNPTFLKSMFGSTDVIPL